MYDTVSSRPPLTRLLDAQAAIKEIGDHLSTVRVLLPPDQSLSWFGRRRARRRRILTFGDAVTAHRTVRHYAAVIKSTPGPKPPGELANLEQDVAVLKAYVRAFDATTPKRPKPVDPPENDEHPEGAENPGPTTSEGEPHHGW